MTPDQEQRRTGFLLALANVRRRVLDQSPAIQFQVTEMILDTLAKSSRYEFTPDDHEAIDELLAMAREKWPLASEGK